MSNAEIRGRFIWHELLTNDTAAAASFYAKVAAWRSQPSNMPGYTIFMAGPIQIGGLMAHPAEAAASPPHWLVYIGTPDVDATCARAQSLGGRIYKPGTDIPNVGRFAVLADPQGAAFAVFTPAGSAPAGQPPQGGFSWHELATTDVAGALRFYGELFGWRKGAGHDMGAMGVYQIFDHAGSPAGGMCNTQGPSTPPSWLSYINVPDVNRGVAAVKSAGGRLLHGPTEVPGGSWIALFLDPQGGAFAVQQSPRTTTASKGAPTSASKSAPTAAAKPKIASATAARASRSVAPKKAVKKAAKKSAKKRSAPKKKTAAKKDRRTVAKKATRKAPRRVTARRRTTARGVTRRSTRGGRGRRR